jgi:hypothetical protein
MSFLFGMLTLLALQIGTAWLYRFHTGKWPVRLEL